MKILFNCLTMEKGGAERVIALLADEFSKNNDVSILTLTKSKDAYKLSKSVKRLCVDKTSYKNDNKIRRKFRKISLVRFFRLKKVILRERPDVIISFLPEPSLRLMLVKKFSMKIRKIPVIISIRNDPAKEYANPPIKLAVRVLYKNVNGMVYQTREAKKYFKDIVRTKNQVVIANPVHDDVLVEPNGDAQRGNVVVSVGRLEEQKNHEMLIRAFGRTLEQKQHDFVLKIYGEGALRESLQDLIEKLGLNGKVFLEGQVDDVAVRLNQAKIFVLSSHYEGMPNALIEAMAMGLPCISTDCPCGGPRELIVNGEDGLLVGNDDVAAMSGALVELMSDARLRKKLAKNALKIREKNSKSKIVDEWNNLIRNVGRAR